MASGDSLCSGNSLGALPLPLFPSARPSEEELVAQDCFMPGCNSVPLTSFLICYPSLRRTFNQKSKIATLALFCTV